MEEEEEEKPRPPAVGEKPKPTATDDSGDYHMIHLGTLQPTSRTSPTTVLAEALSIICQSVP